MGRVFRDEEGGGISAIRAGVGGVSTLDRHSRPRVRVPMQ